MIRCCVAIMAYNEEACIGHVLDALLAQKTRTVSIEKFIVITSGCTDRTEEIVEEFVARDDRIQLVHQNQRRGKASAINLLMELSDQEVIVLHNADTLSEPTTIEALVCPLADPEVGMVGGRPVPINPPTTFMGFGVQLLWELHHQISLRRPKMGELIAFRNVFRQIPSDSAVDEASIEPLIIGQGLRILYAPEAIIRNKGPETVRDFLKQRRRIFAGHLYVKDLVGYQVSTIKGLPIAWLYIRNIKLDWRYFVWGPAVIALEILGRFWGAYDYRIWKRKPFVWPVAETTKDLRKAVRRGTDVHHPQGQPDKPLWPLDSEQHSEAIHPSAIPSAEATVSRSL
jgi:biofilm PGA synthesis N-glycosyltransferase PgaC